MLYAHKFSIVRPAILIIAAFAVPLYYYANDPAAASFHIPCLFHKLTGLECWGCGGQRAFHQLLHGNFSAALRLNALVFPVVTLMGFVVISELKNQETKYSWLRKKEVQISAIILFSGFTILRNLL